MKKAAQTIRNILPGLLPRRKRPTDPGAFPEAALYKLVQPYTFACKEKLAHLRALALKVRDQGIPGDVVECGTCRGGSAAVLATTLAPRQHLWLYDSFQGMPPISDRDGPDAAQYVGQGVATEQEVIGLLEKVGIAKDRYTIRKGWFHDSFKLNLPKQIAFLHCDADWFESVLLVLETIYPRISPGGCIVLDDFGYWEGCREAFYAFCAKHNESPLLERFSIDQAWWVKSRTHNRPPADPPKS